jgi:hypothetical protein
MRLRERKRTRMKGNCGGGGGGEKGTIALMRGKCGKRGMQLNKRGGLVQSWTGIEAYMLPH